MSASFSGRRVTRSVAVIQADPPTSTRGTRPASLWAASSQNVGAAVTMSKGRTAEGFLKRSAPTRCLAVITAAVDGLNSPGFLEALRG